MDRWAVRRAASWGMGTVFLLSALVQYNDPDPLRWGALYFAAALACYFDSKRWARLLAAVVLVWAGIWAVLLAPSILGRFAASDLMKSMKAESPEIELSRELLGLVLVALWMVVLLVTARRASAARS